MSKTITVKRAKKGDIIKNKLKKDKYTKNKQYSKIKKKRY